MSNISTVYTRRFACNETVSLCDAPTTSVLLSHSSAESILAHPP